METEIILGPPGTGKTTTLLEIVEDAIASGIPPYQIAFVSFTKKAAYEARDRAMDKFGLSKDDLPYFRTLHSIAYRALGLSSNEILPSFAPITDELGLSSRIAEDDTLFMPMGTGQAGEIAFLESMARMRMVPLEQQWHDWQAGNPHEYVDWYLLKNYHDTLKQYKLDEGLLDHTDTLEEFVSQDLTLPVKLFIVDEAQDLSALQWKMIRKASRAADRVIIAGDDDQAIYEWAGADVEQFLTLKGRKRVLSKTHRLPRSIFDFANDIVDRIDRRYDKIWHPRDAEGSVDYANSVDNVDLSRNETYMILARNRRYLNYIISNVHDRGFTYRTSKTETSIDPNKVDVIKAWEHLRAGKTLDHVQVQRVLENIAIGHGLKRGARARINRFNEDHRFSLRDLLGMGLETTEVWHDALTGMPLEDREYMLMCLRNGEKLSQSPRIYVGTIHSVKGGQADNVILVPDMSKRTWNNYLNNEDSEHRVWYVGATRASQRLTVIFPSSTRHYVL